MSIESSLAEFAAHVARTEAEQRAKGEAQNRKMRSLREHRRAVRAGESCVCDACWEGSDGQQVAREFAR